MAFDPSRYRALRFTARELDAGGRATLRYALEGDSVDPVAFAEEIDLPVPGPLDAAARARVERLLALLHWTAGVSYYKAAAPPDVAFDGPAPGPAAARLLEALYSEGLGEFAYVNRLPALPRPSFGAPAHAAPAPAPPADPRRALVPVGGGKDSVVALETVHHAGVEALLFSVGAAGPIVRTAEVAGLPHLVARRRLDARIGELNAAGALNGHVPITAIVTCIAALTAALHGADAVVMANERSASQGNLAWDGVEVNHQFSKGRRAEVLLRAALVEAAAAPGAARVDAYSLLRPASELAIARAFARLPRYHHAFTSCNRVFRLDPARRGSGWCGACPKCRFVFLVLAPWLAPAELSAIFGADLLDDPAQAEGFAELTGLTAHKPFECVGEEEESIAALRLVAARPEWASHAVVRRLAAELLAGLPAAVGDPASLLALSGDHDVPPTLLASLDALLGA